MTELHVDRFGAGPCAVFVHGSFGWGLDTFPEQRALADRVEVILVDRRGFGKSPHADTLGWPTDMFDVAALLDEVAGAHLVGQSYGAVVCLLAAGIRPELVRSLAAIEPPAFELARGDPGADALTAAWKPVYEHAADMTPREFIEGWARAGGRSDGEIAEWLGSFTDEDWRAADSSRRERWPGDAPIAFEALAESSFPKVLVRGAWAPEIAPGRELTGNAFRAVCETIAERTDGRIVVFEDSSHNPQLQEPDRFNRLLREIWDSAA